MNVLGSLPFPNARQKGEPVTLSRVKGCKYVASATRNSVRKFTYPIIRGPKARDDVFNGDETDSSNRSRQDNRQDMECDLDLATGHAGQKGWSFE